MPKRKTIDEDTTNEGGENNDSSLAEGVASPSTPDSTPRSTTKRAKRWTPSSSGRKYTWGENQQVIHRRNLYQMNQKMATWAAKFEKKLTAKRDTGAVDLDDEEEAKMMDVFWRYQWNAKDLRNTYERASGDMLTFGWGDCGQLALELGGVNTPQLVAVVGAAARDSSPFRRVTFVACGGLHNAVLTNDGEVYTWGCNDDGSLGDPKAPETTTVPVPIHFEFNDQKEDIFWLAAGDTQTLAVSNEGRVFMFGAYKDAEGKVWRDVPLPHKNATNQDKISIRDKQLTPLHVHLLKKQVEKVACGCSFNVAKFHDDTIATWGIGDCGELGREVPSRKKDDKYDLKVIEEQYLTPLPPTWSGGTALPVQSVGCGGYHLLVITNGFDLYTSGLNSYGQLGHGDKDWRNCLTRVEALSNEKVVHCDAGMHHTLCSNKDGNLFSFGRGDSGQLGITDTIPPAGYCETKPVAVSLPDSEKAEEVSCGANHNLVLTESGNVYSWGYGDEGTLGHGVGKDEYRPRKLDVLVSIREKGLKNVKVHQVAGGGQHSVIIGTCE